MKVGFLGLGKLGLPVAMAIEARGHDVWGEDSSPEVEQILKTRKLPYEEVMAQELLEHTRITSWPTCSGGELPAWADIIFVAVQTPHAPEYEGVTRLPETRVDFDYSYLKTAVCRIASYTGLGPRFPVVAIISTVLPGTIEREIKPLAKNIRLCYNPFFIAMGTVIRDFYNPEFVLIGSDDDAASDTLCEFYESLYRINAKCPPIEVVSIATAELVKVIYNTNITAKITTANTMMQIADSLGADADEVTRLLSLATERIVSPAYMKGGMGDGGACHPRDCIAMSYLARNLDLGHDWFETLMMARESQTEWLADLIIDEHRSRKLPVALLGKAFKAGTNITTGSPALLLANILNEKGIEFKHWDPHVDAEKPRWGEPHVFFLATCHEEFSYCSAPAGSVVIDPWRFVNTNEGVERIQLGRR